MSNNLNCINKNKNKKKCYNPSYYIIKLDGTIEYYCSNCNPRNGSFKN